jgi:RimJ/RimL family protein N-acetyltransferase
MDLRNVHITTERLRIEPVSSTYSEDVFREFTTEITTYMYPKPHDSIEQQQERLQANLKELEKGTDLNVVVLDKNTGEFLGRCGIHKVDTSVPELGLWIKKSAHGNGYGKEAITALKDWADAHVDADYYVYPVDKRNVGSRKIAESLGGVVKKEYKKTKMSGDILDEVEYHIPVSR